jgi:hypothetical protein
MLSAFHTKRTIQKRAENILPAFDPAMRLVLMIVFLWCSQLSVAQMVEVYGGNKRAGVDILWFKYFRKADSTRTPWLFFSRNRASVNYSNQSLWGSTNAVSYNFKNGLGIVAVGAFSTNGFVPKAGVQYFKQKGDFLFFGWLVADLQSNGNVDLFGLFRYQPPLNARWRLLTQAELFPIYHPGSKLWNLTQRFRLGLKYHSWGGGLMLDLNQTGIESFTTTHNVGGFIRHEF